MKFLLCHILALCLFIGAVHAEPRPEKRSEALVAIAAAIKSLEHPKPVSAFLDLELLKRLETKTYGALAEASALRESRPVMRPAALGLALSAGGVCGSPRILGRKMARITSQTQGCGIDAPVRVRAIAGIALSPHAVINCETAQAIELWFTQTVHPVLAAEGLKATRFDAPASYACRTRNHKKGAKISEHGKGNAIDFSAIHFSNGDVTTLLQGWQGSRVERRIWRSLHKGACGPFGTVLGPDSDKYHQDHFHFDIARYRGGPYCR